MFYAYILKSKIDGRFYKGMTQNLEVGLKQHNSGKVKSSKGYVPWELMYFEKFATRIDAGEREKYFKTGAGREFLKQKLAT